MKCPECNSNLKKIKVKIEGALKKVISFQCTHCNHFEFEQKSAKKIIEELESPLKLRHKVIKLSQNRLGLYFNKHLIESLTIKKGQEVLISVPDKKHILLTLN